MQAAKKRNISAGDQYAHMFPKATGVIQTIKGNASVGDTLTFIKGIVPATLHQTKDIAAALKGDSTYDTCRNIWHFVYRHIAYKKDKDGYEQVRSPRRSWRDRKSGVDCDCYTTFISSILTNLRIAHVLRITKYYKPYFQHIYPIVPNGSGYITIDCVTDRFNYEVPFSEKKDVNMDLQYLDGLDAMPYSSVEDVINGNDEFGELGLFGRRRRKKAAAAEAASADMAQNPDAVPSTGKKKKKGFFRKLLNVANKVNPVTLALRNGVLAAMKLNIGKIGSRLRWSYLSPNAAKAKGIDMPRYAQLVQTRQKLEDIFSNAGGNPANMKKAILKGKGNKDHAVNGLMGLGAIMMDSDVMQMNIHTPLSQLLGTEIYYDENVRGMEGFAGFGELGEPVTLATVGAAAGVIAAIAASLKKIGDIFKGKKTEGSEDFSEDAAAAAAKDVAAVKEVAPAAVANNPATSAAAANFNPPAEDTGNNPGANNAAMARTVAPPPNDTSGDDDTPGAAAKGAGSNKSADNAPDKKPGFWDANKKWIIPVGIGVAVIGVGMKLMHAAPAPVPAAPSRAKALNGAPKRKPHKRKRSSHRRGRHKPPIALM